MRSVSRMAYPDRDRRDKDAKDALVHAAAQLSAAASAHGRVPPHDLDAERAVLGGILLDNSAMATVEAIIAPADFYHPAHAVIYEAIQAISARREPVDIVTLASELRARERLNTVGGAQYLGELTDTIPTIAHIESHARIVADHAGVRRMIEVAHEIVARGYGDHGTADQFLDHAASKVFEVAQKRSKSTLIPLEQVILEAFERIENTLVRGARITGTETGFRDLDTLTSGMHGGQLIIIAARPAMGKCLSADAEIVLEDGRVETIETLHRAGEARLLTLGDDWRLAVTSPSHYVDDGMKPVFRVTTRLGRTVEATAPHPFLTIDGWRPLMELSVGERVAVPRRIPVFGDRELRACEVTLLGYLLGDGCLTGTQPSFTNTTPRVLDDFTRAVEAFGPLRVRADDVAKPRAPSLRVTTDGASLAGRRAELGERLSAQLRGGERTSRSVASALGVSPSLVTQWTQGRAAPSPEAFERLCAVLSCAPDDLAPSGLPRGRDDRNPLTAWLRALGLWGCDAHAKFVPPVVFTLRREQVALFLNRLFATDGWATVLASGQAQVGYASVSERLARQVCHLLLRFGVIASLRRRTVRYQGGERAAWQIDITDAPSIRAFAEHIGIFGKEEALDRAVRALADRQPHTNRDLVPASVWSRLDAARNGESWSSVGKRAGIAGHTNLHVGARSLSRDRLAALACALHDRALEHLAASDVYWDEIVSIEPVGLKRVYDLTIPETHNFVANDVCVHNTSFVLNVTSSAAESSQKPVLFFSLEMPRIELANRLMCADARIDQSRLRSNLLTQDDVTALTASANKLHSLPIYIDDSGDLTLLELRAKARRIKSERDMSLIVIDYLQLMKASRERMDSREREISEISRGLKGLAKELDVPIIALSQLNRGCETRPGKDKRPMLADLRESGAIEQDADVVMFIYRDEVYNRDTEDKGIAEIIIAKQRNGPTDTIRLRFIRELTKFENLALDEHGYGDANVAGLDDLPPGGGELEG